MQGETRTIEGLTITSHTVVWGYEYGGFGYRFIQTASRVDWSVTRYRTVQGGLMPSDRRAMSGTNGTSGTLEEAVHEALLAADSLWMKLDAQALEGMQP